ncbi:MAG TPA: SprT family protein [Staphylococcus kloosii]|jgi:SprT-like protein|uniref:Protein SprT-like n=1 Tax=Staphylococcus kloosii TaxID=29384 RepID=A0A151A0Q6_9STAP|nr:SprT family protein [Staphylococcus kloosii]KYH12959.1 SprT family protein [Staphylococcus kloosii]HJF67490.1 SprT family protein [Staphylococcus kloosii]
MNNDDLQTLVTKLSVTYFDKNFKHKAYFNHRLRTTGGRYLLDSHNIEINYKQYEKFGIEAIKDIIKHELCHYHLHIEGRGYKHRDRDFKILSASVNAPRFCTPTKSYEERANYLYQCTKCGKQFMRIKKVNTRKMACGLCKGKLKLLNTLK